MRQAFFLRPDIGSAIRSLRPNSSYILTDMNYESIIWGQDNVDPIPSRKEIEDELVKLYKVAEKQYAISLRNAEYPPIQDLMDGIVKDDQEQINAYKQAYLAVNEKYPIPGDE